MFVGRRLLQRVQVRAAPWVHAVWAPTPNHAPARHSTLGSLAKRHLATSSSSPLSSPSKDASRQSSDEDEASPVKKVSLGEALKMWGVSTPESLGTKPTTGSRDARQQAVDLNHPALASSILFTLNDCVAKHEFHAPLRILERFEAPASFYSSFIVSASWDGEHRVVVAAGHLAQKRGVELTVPALRSVAYSATDAGDFNAAHWAMLQMAASKHMPSEGLISHWLAGVLQRDLRLNPHAKLRAFLPRLEELPYVTFKRRLYHSLLPYARTHRDITDLYAHAKSRGMDTKRLATQCVREHLGRLTARGSNNNSSSASDNADVASSRRGAAMSAHGRAYILSHDVVPLVVEHPSHETIAAVLPLLAEYHLSSSLEELTNLWKERLRRVDPAVAVQTLEKLCTLPQDPVNKAHHVVHGTLRVDLASRLSASADNLVRKAFPAAVRPRQRISRDRRAANESDVVTEHVEGDDLNEEVSDGAQEHSVQESLMLLCNAALDVCAFTHSVAPVETVLQRLSTLDAVMDPSQAHALKKVLIDETLRGVVARPAIPSLSSACLQALTHSRVHVDADSVLIPLIERASRQKVCTSKSKNALAPASTLAMLPPLVSLSAFAFAQAPSTAVQSVVEDAVAAIARRFFVEHPSSSTALCVPIKGLLRAASRGSHVGTYVASASARPGKRANMQQRGGLGSSDGVSEVSSQERDSEDSLASLEGEDATRVDGWGNDDDHMSPAALNSNSNSTSNSSSSSSSRRDNVAAPSTSSAPLEALPRAILPLGQLAEQHALFESFPDYLLFVARTSQRELFDKESGGSGGANANGDPLLQFAKTFNSHSDAASRDKAHRPLFASARVWQLPASEGGGVDAHICADSTAALTDGVRYPDVGSLVALLQDPANC